MRVEIRIETAGDLPENRAVPEIEIRPKAPLGIGIRPKVPEIGDRIAGRIVIVHPVREGAEAPWNPFLHFQKLQFI